MLDRLMTTLEFQETIDHGEALVDEPILRPNMTVELLDNFLVFYEGAPE